MSTGFSDEQVAVGVRAVALAAEIVLRRLRDPNFLAVGDDDPLPAVVDEPPSPADVGSPGGWRGLARHGGELVRQGGHRARQGVATGLQRWMSERPGTDGWQSLTVDERTEWWLSYLGRTTAVLAALPGLAGFAGDRVPVKDLVSVAGQGLLLCAIAGEYGIDDVDDHVVLLGQVVLGRDLARLSRGARREAENEASTLVADMEAARNGGRKRAMASSLLGMGRSLQHLEDELDKRPQGHAGQRMAGALPMIGVIGHYQGERRGLTIAAERGRAWCAERLVAGEPAAVPPAPVVPVPVAPALPEPQGITFSDALTCVADIGEERRRSGHAVEQLGDGGGYFLVATPAAPVGIIVWPSGQRWTMSVFSCPRARMRPALELHRYVSRWRSTAGMAAPYVVEDRGEAAVMCERTLSGLDAVDVRSLRALVEATIEQVADASALLARDLGGADGVTPFGQGAQLLMDMCRWWDVRDDRILAMVGRT
ncbi:hypothetical protein [Actinomycetospora aeridis]|uniref:Uncharacterized protein n=1 Tax=Actinomycetospora aeridis TaxID=3129231 RepID=A0ABU8N6I7_9PSEU